MVLKTNNDDTVRNLGRGASWSLLPVDARLVFNGLIIVVSILPIAIYAMHTHFQPFPVWAYFMFLVPMIGTLSGTHVFATTYLYISDRELTRGVAAPMWTLALIPAFLILISMVAALSFSLEALIYFMAVYMHYGIFHFGRQNLGMLSLCTLSTMSRPINGAEKFIINATTAAAVCATMKISLPTLNIDPILFHVDPSWLTKPPYMWSELAYTFGQVFFAGVFLFAIYTFVRGFRGYSRMGMGMYWVAALWFAPLFLFIDNPLLAIASFTTAHGLQYLVVLIGHAWYARGSRNQRLNDWAFRAGEYIRSRGPEWANARIGTDDSRNSFKAMNIVISSCLPLVLLGLTLYLAKYIWLNSVVLFTDLEGILVSFSEVNPVARAGIGLVLGLTLAHYWVDQFIWRFRTPERRKWLTSRFQILAPQSGK